MMSFAYRHGTLNEHEAFWAPGAKTVRPLKNDIHSLWKQDNFRMGGRGEFRARCMQGLQWDDPRSRMPTDTYKVIEPALRLASMFLGHSRQFFMMILRAKEVQVKGVNVVVRDGLLTNRAWLQCLDPMWRPNSDDEKAYDEAVGQIARDFRIYCAEDSKTIIPGSSVYAATSCSATPSFWNYNYLSREFFDEFSSSRFKHGSVQQHHRLLFLFAVVLLHELAHVMLHKKVEADFMRRMIVGGPCEPEPLFQPTDVTPELGHAWEHWAFGGMINPTGSPGDMRGFGLRWFPWLWARDPRNKLCLDYPYSEFIVHASTMSRFFSTTGWDNHRNESKSLLVELTPLRALCGHVEDEEANGYDGFFRRRLEHVYRGMSSAAIRNYSPVTPLLQPIPLNVDDIDMNIPDLKQTGRRMLKRRAGKVQKQKMSVEGDLIA
jgi:hypothetical protein